MFGLFFQQALELKWTFSRLNDCFEILALPVQINVVFTSKNDLH